MSVFITLEGGDSAGKSTQISLLLAYLRERQIDFISTREPGGTAVGDAIRHVLLSPEYKMSVITEALLYAASRTEHVQNVIEPALRQGQVVVCDRFVDSSMAYQAIGGHLPEEFVREINLMATGGLTPHRTILIDIDPEVAAKRRQGEHDRMEAKDLEFHRQVREYYLELAKAEPRRVKVVDGTLPPEQMAAQIRRLVDEVLPRRPKP